MFYVEVDGNEMFITLWQTLFSTKFVTDIDECLEQTSGCEQRCSNTPGAFACQCFIGFSLKSDRATCSKLGLYWGK